jgi:hypothetical protein
MAKPGPISAKPLSVLLSDVFSDAYARQGFAARELVTRWAEIAGAEIAAHCEPLKLQWPRPVEGQPQEAATLVLRVEGPMALEIQHASDVILERVNRSGKVRCRGGKQALATANRIRARLRKSQKPCLRLRMRRCGPRWRDSVLQSSEIEPTPNSRNCYPPLPHCRFRASQRFFRRESANFRSRS